MFSFVTQFGYPENENDFHVSDLRSSDICSETLYWYFGSYSTGLPISSTVDFFQQDSGGFTAPSQPQCSSEWIRQTKLDYPPAPITFYGGNKEITCPDSTDYTEPEFDWLCGLGIIAGQTANASGIGCLWSNGKQKILGPTSPIHHIKINNLGQAILKHEGQNFWQNGRMYDLDDLSMLGDGEHIVRPYDISTGASNVLVALKQNDNSSIYALLIRADMRISKYPGKADDKFLMDYKEAENPGAYVPVNANNDNGSPFKFTPDGRPTHLPEKRDFDSFNLSKDDPQLVKIKLDVDRTLPFLAQLQFEENGRAKISLWKDQRKKEAYFPHAEPFKTLPSELWVEGVREGEAQGEILLKKSIIAYGVERPAETITITVTPILEAYASKALNATSPQFASTSRQKFMVAGDSKKADLSIEVRATIFRKNMAGRPRQVQTVYITNPIAATIEDAISHILVKTFAYDFNGNGAGKTLIDGADAPFYGEDWHFNGDSEETWLLDRPQIVFDNVLPGATTQLLTLYMFWMFNDYVVWEYPDGSIYTIGHTQWNIYWSGTYRYTVDPAGVHHDVWEYGPANSMNFSPRFLRRNTDPPITYPTATEAGFDFE